MDLPLQSARPLRHRGTVADAVFWASMASLALIGTLIVVVIAAFLLREAIPMIHDKGFAGFLLGPGWWPQDGSFNMAPMVVASLLLTCGALVVATPLGLALAIQLTFLGPRSLTRPLHGLLEASAAVPTVIYGLWGITVVVPIINAFAPPGASLLAGIIVVAIMIFPTITLLAQEALRAVPGSYAQAAAGLGISTTQTILRVVLPAARPGILSALVLGAARAIGETMVVLMVCGNIVQVPDSLFAPVRTLTANIALEMPYAMGDHRSSLFVAGLLMFLLVCGLVALAEGLSGGSRSAPA